MHEAYAAPNWMILQPLTALDWLWTRVNAHGYSPSSFYTLEMRLGCGHNQHNLQFVGFPRCKMRCFSRQHLKTSDSEWGPRQPLRLRLSVLRETVRAASSKPTEVSFQPSFTPHTYSNDPRLPRLKIIVAGFQIDPAQIQSYICPSTRINIPPPSLHFFHIQNTTLSPAPLFHSVTNVEIFRNPHSCD